MTETDKNQINALAEAATNSGREMAVELGNRFGVKRLVEIWEQHNVDVRAWHGAVKAAYEARIATLEAQLAEAERRGAIRAEHAEWSQKSFGDVSAVGPAKHLAKEAMEVAADPNDIMEHVDCQFLLWDMQRRAGFTDAEIIAAMAKKMPILKSRKYPPPKEGEPREHERALPLTEGGDA